MGRWEEALRQLDVAERLNPLDTDHLGKCFAMTATSLIALHRYDEAIEWAHRLAAVNPTSAVPYSLYAAAEAHRGNLEVARRHAAEAMARNPQYTIKGLRFGRGSTAPAFVAGMDHLAAGLRLAGVPE